MISYYGNKLTFLFTFNPEKVGGEAECSCLVSKILNVKVHIQQPPCRKGVIPMLLSCFLKGVGLHGDDLAVCIQQPHRDNPELASSCYFFCEASGQGPHFMALLTVKTKLALTEAGNSVLTASVFHGLAANFCFCPCVLHVTRHSMLQG